ncbi:unnamed protein product [Pleuronectes platessa]|uniref:Uncharacterized protein n=1 Tax=Pleuronectes platessa TaxID=8262 RepID=A0A9N7VSR4_PLEPL|nr:unnamed protein product [Pleuronectes platessa]
MQRVSLLLNRFSSSPSPTPKQEHLFLVLLLFLSIIITIIRPPAPSVRPVHLWPLHLELMNGRFRVSRGRPSSLPARCVRPCRSHDTAESPRVPDRVFTLQFVFRVRSGRNEQTGSNVSLSAQLVFMDLEKQRRPPAKWKTYRSQSACFGACGKKPEYREKSPRGRTCKVHVALRRQRGPLHHRAAHI